MKMNIILKDVPPNTERQKEALEHAMQHVGNWLTGVWSANRGTNTYTALPVQKETFLCLLLGVKSNRATNIQITKLGDIFTTD